MKIQFKGKFSSPEKMNRAMAVVLSDLMDRLGVPKEAEMAIQDLQFKAVFNINGQDKYISVPREVQSETIYEIFTVDVALDEDGAVIKQVDNEDESFYDGYTMAQALGKDYDYQTIESGYADSDLEEIERIEPDESDVLAVRYNLLTEDGTEVIRYYKAGNLIFEEVIKNKK